MQSDTDAGGSFVERARRAQIVAAATETIAEEGFGRASLARIAAHAGIGKGVILYHFGSKDELVRAVVTEVYVGAATEIAVAVEAAPTHGGRLAAYLRGNVAFLAEHRLQVRALNEIFVSFRGEDGRLAYDESGLETVLAPLEAVLRAGQEAGELREFDTRVMARTVRAAIDAVTPRLGVAPDLDLDAYAEELVDLFDRATRA